MSHSNLQDELIKEQRRIECIKRRFRNIDTIPMSYTLGIFDTETTGTKPQLKFIHPLQIAALIVKTPTRHNSSRMIDTMNTLVKTDGWDSYPEALAIHGITKERADAEGIPLKDALQMLYDKLKDVDAVVGHNIRYDLDDVVLPCMKLVGMESEYDILSRKPRICTCDIGARICIPILGFRETFLKNGNSIRNLTRPRLLVLYKILTGKEFDKPAHDAMNDCWATHTCLQIIIQKYLKYLRTYPDCNDLFKYDNFTDKSRSGDIFGVGM